MDVEWGLPYFICLCHEPFGNGAECESVIFNIIDSDSTIGFYFNFVTQAFGL